MSLAGNLQFSEVHSSAEGQAQPDRSCADFTACVHSARSAGAPWPLGPRKQNKDGPERILWVVSGCLSIWRCR